MGGPILNIVLGLVMVGGGLSGRLVLIGTDSGGYLAMLGAGLAGLGVWRLMKERRARTPAVSEASPRSHEE